MITIILAAGYGTRLYPLTLNKPKALLEVGKKTILDRLVENITRIGSCGKIYIVTNEKFHRNFGDWAGNAGYPVPIEAVNDGTLSNETRLGAIGDINFVLEKVKPSEDLLITGSDNLFDLELEDFVKFASLKRPHPSIVLVDVKDTELAKKYGICSLDGESRVLSFEEKPEVPGSTLAATALYFVPKESINGIYEYVKTDLPKDAPGNLMKWFAREYALYGFVMDKEWYDIGDKESLRKADEEFTGKEKGK